MNKLGLALGLALAMVLAGCKDPNYVRKNGKVQNEAKTVPAETTKDVEVVPVEPVQEDTPEVVVVDEQKPEPVQTKPEPQPEVKPAEPEYTLYIVQRGDYLAKISKQFNVKIDAIRKANPQVKNDVVKLGQTLKIPGKHEVGEQKVPEGAFAKSTPKNEGSYKGATKEYVVVSGDTLGKIAYGNGINIRQLKELNGLKDNTIYVGQKLKIPAEVQKAPAPAMKKAEPAKAKVESKKEESKKVEEVKPQEQPVVQDLAAKESTEPKSIVAAIAAEPSVAEPEVPVQNDEPAVSFEGVDYVVQDGEDVLGLSIRFNLNPTEIREMNNLGEGDELKAGQVLRLPPGVQLN